MDGIYRKLLTEPVLLHVLKRAKQQDIHGNTTNIIKELEEFDREIIGDVKNRKDTMSSTKGVRDAFDDLDSATTAMKELTEAAKALNKSKYSAGKYADFMFETAGIVKKVSGVLYALYTAHLIEALAVTQPGRVCVAAKNAFDGDPNFRQYIPMSYITCENTAGGL